MTEKRNIFIYGFFYVKEKVVANFSITSEEDFIFGDKIFFVCARLLLPGEIGN